MKGILRGLSQNEQTTGVGTTGTTPLTTGTTSLTSGAAQQSGIPTSQTSMLTGVTPLTTGATGTTPLTRGSTWFSGTPAHTTFMEEPRQVVNLPAIVQEKIVPQQLTEIQPVIHRDREQVEVHKVVQPLSERDIAPTQMQYSTLPEEFRPEYRMPDTDFQQQYRAAPIQPQTTVAPTETSFVEMPPVIDETVHKKIIEEIQPVLYKEVVQPIVVTQTKPIHETVVEAPRLLTEQLPMRDLGVRSLEAQPYIQQPIMQQQFYQQPSFGQYPQQRSVSQYPQQVGLTGLPPRDVKPSLDLLGDNTGHGAERSVGTGLGSGLTAPMQYQTTGMTQLPSAQAYPGHHCVHHCSADLTPGTTAYPQQQFRGEQPTTGLSNLPQTQQGLTQPQVLSEEILKVEYEVFNAEPNATEQAFVERTVTKALQVTNPTGTTGTTPLTTGTFGDKSWESQQLSGTTQGFGTGTFGEKSWESQQLSGTTQGFGTGVNTGKASTTISP